MYIIYVVPTIYITVKQIALDVLDVEFSRSREFPIGCDSSVGPIKLMVDDIVKSHIATCFS